MAVLWLLRWSHRLPVPWQESHRKVLGLEVSVTPWPPAGQSCPMPCLHPLSWQLLCEHLIGPHPPAAPARDVALRLWMEQEKGAVLPNYLSLVWGWQRWYSQALTWCHDQSCHLARGALCPPRALLSTALCCWSPAPAAYPAHRCASRVCSSRKPSASHRHVHHLSSPCWCNLCVRSSLYD